MKCKCIGNILAGIGIVLFAYTLLARFVGERSILGFSKIAVLGQGFTAVGMFSGISCLLLIAIICFIKGNCKEKE